jgi:Flp pilus assembly protein TadD
LREEERIAAEHEEKARKQELTSLLSRVRTALKRDDSREALEVIAQAFTLDPFDEEVNSLEQEVRQRVARKKIVDQKPPSEGSETSLRVQEMIAEAERLLSADDLDNAFDEITRALSLDPLNPHAKVLEDEITKRLMSHEQDGEAAGAAGNDPEPTRADVTMAAPTEPVKERSVTAHTPAHDPPSAGGISGEWATNVENLVRSGAFDEALAEVAIALLENPDDSVLRALERRIWEEQERRQQEKGNPSLRLIHPRSSAGAEH